jgi:predicted small metal-binding protein
LTIAGSEDEVITAAAQHAVSVHGHEDNEELRSWLKDNLKDEALTH